jgi:hypothetical protein
MEELDPEDRVSYLEEAIAFGNYERASNKEVLLNKLVKMDIIHGYGIILPLDKMELVPGILTAPMNITNQNLID